MFSRADRREWAVLGLVALAWCLLIAPMLHRLTHSHGHAHTHASSANFEHQTLSFTAPAEPPQVVAMVTRVELAKLASPAAPAVELLRRVEQSQAPWPLASRPALPFTNTSSRSAHVACFSRAVRPRRSDRARC